MSAQKIPPEWIGKDPGTPPEFIDKRVSPPAFVSPTQEIKIGRSRLDLSPLSGDAQPLVFFNVQPQTGEERMWYALGYDGAQTFEAVPVEFQKFYDLGASDKKEGRAPRATWVQETAVKPAQPAAESSANPPGPAPTKPLPIWPLVVGGIGATAGIALLLAASRRKKRNVRN